MESSTRMPNNDQIVLDQILQQRKREIDPSADDSSFFELFTAEQVLKDFDLSYDEIESGLIGGGQDGGIDGLYVLVNGELAQEDPDFSYLRRDAEIEIIIIQSKTSSGFQETPIERFITISDDIFDLGIDPNSIRDIYRDELIEGIHRFRTCYYQLVSVFPMLTVSFYYACKGTTPNRQVMRKGEKLRAVVATHFPKAQCNVKFLGASDLLDRARRVPKTRYILTLAENPISSGGQVGFVCLVGLRHYYDFITDDKGSLIRPLFEANVRDYQGSTPVNEEIQTSLQSRDREDFWWLNNGVSVLASDASLGGKMLTIEDPRIVNGLQTSREIYRYFRDSNTEKEDRGILVRVIVPKEEESRDRIIKATNSQTVVQMASLRATEKIHRDIEDYLRPMGLYYDRRKNFYKNEGKPRERIFSIKGLAQAVLAIVLWRPDTARARPSSLFKDEDSYSKVFDPNHLIGVYAVCATAMLQVERILKSSSAKLTAKDRNNLRFYVAMHAIGLMTKSKRQVATEIGKIDIKKLTDRRIKKSLAFVRAAYERLGGDDDVAKGSALLPVVRDDIKRRP